MVLSGAWNFERMETRQPPIVIRPPIELPAAAGNAAPPAAPTIPPKVPPKVIAKDTHQPEPKRTDEPAPVVTDGQQTPGTRTGPGDLEPAECLENCGDAEPSPPVCGNSAVEVGEQCDDGNGASGDGCSSTCRTEVPPPRPPQPRVVVTSVLQALRIAGDTQPRPSPGTQQMMLRNDHRTVRASVYLCIGTDGSLGSVKLTTPTGYPDYDQTILAAVGTWRYRPYTVDGRPHPACSAVMFVYSIQ